MAKKIDIPIVAGPGSQPPERDGATMNFMPMPAGMFTYQAPPIPEAEEALGLDAAISLAHDIQSVLAGYQVDQAPQVFGLTSLDTHHRRFFDQLLGEGEVSVQCLGGMQALIQESVLAGVWRVQYVDDNQQVIRDTIEIAAIPSLVTQLSFHRANSNLSIENLSIPDDVYNAAPLLAEIHDALSERDAASNDQTISEPHVINLSLLPHTEQDLLYLSDQLGIGSIVILSRGYGNCRISSTNTRNVWWVQYFNSQETLILNTLEITQVPEVACASQEDIDDSALRLQEILNIYPVG